MAQHLAFIKLRHWEPAVRELAAQALAAISPFNPDYMIKNILPKLIESCLDKALHVRHGAILGVGELLIGLSGNASLNKRDTLDIAFKSLSIKEIELIADSDYRTKFLELYNRLSNKDYLPEMMPEGSEIRTSIKDIIKKVDAARLYRGKGGEIMRGGVCHLIKAMAIAKLQISNNSDREYLFEQLLENFKHPNSEIQEEATRAFEYFC
jgi:hypothetical protein